MNRISRIEKMLFRQPIEDYSGLSISKNAPPLPTPEQILQYPAPASSNYADALATVTCAVSIDAAKDAALAFCGNRDFELSDMRWLVVNGFMDEMPDLNVIASVLFDCNNKSVSKCPSPTTCPNCMRHKRWLHRVTPEDMEVVCVLSLDSEVAEEVSIYEKESAEDPETVPGTYYMVTTVPIVPADIGSYLQEIDDEGNGAIFYRERNYYKGRFFREWVTEDKDDNDDDDADLTDDCNDDEDDEDDDANDNKPAIDKANKNGKTNNGQTSDTDTAEEEEEEEDDGMDTFDSIEI